MAIGPGLFGTEFNFTGDIQSKFRVLSLLKRFLFGDTVLSSVCRAKLYIEHNFT